jgi:CRAL/TRIO domain
LLRFMRGPWGHKEAEKMFRKMLKWREQNMVDTIFDDYVPPKLLLDCIPSAFLKDYDREGDAIYVERAGAVDPGLMKIFSVEELIRHGIWIRERNSNGIWINDYERRQGRYVQGLTIIYDCKGLSANHLSVKGIEYFKQISKITSEMYPNPIKKVIVIRAPKIFGVFWNVVKNFFPARMRRKIVIAGNTGYLEVLEKYMDLNVLPRCIYEGGSGGTAVGMMQDLDGVESLQAYLKANYPSKESQSTIDTDEEESVCSDGCPHDRVEVHGKVIMRGSWDGFDVLRE